MLLGKLAIMSRIVWVSMGSRLVCILVEKAKTMCKTRPIDVDHLDLPVNHMQQLKMRLFFYTTHPPDFISLDISNAISASSFLGRSLFDSTWFVLD